MRRAALLPELEQLRERRQVVSDGEVHVHLGAAVVLRERTDADRVDPLEQLVAQEVVGAGCRDDPPSRLLYPCRVAGDGLRDWLRLHMLHQVTDDGVLYIALPRGRRRVRKGR